MGEIIRFPKHAAAALAREPHVQSSRVGDARARWVGQRWIRLSLVLREKIKIMAEETSP